VSRAQPWHSCTTPHPGDCVNIADVTLLGSYTASMFVTESDGLGGTLVTLHAPHRGWLLSAERIGRSVTLGALLSYLGHKNIQHTVRSRFG
jgi:hypothetical protein